MKKKKKGSGKSKDENVFKLLDFTPEPEEGPHIPELLLEKLEKMVEKAKNKKLTSICLYAEWETEPADEDDDHGGGTMMWNESGNYKELLADAAVLYDSLLDARFHLMGEDE